MSYHYKAFISYKHDPVDSEVAAEIQNRLEKFHVPYALRKEKGVRNLRPVFRDKEELSATEDLNDTIKAALLETEFLIVICSTRSVSSIWVQKEIEFFLEHHDHNKVLTVLVDGEPEEVIPRILYEREVTSTGENGETVTVIEPVEPLSCDYRIERRRARREEFPRLAAALIGCRYNELRNRQRQYQMRLMGAGLCALSLLAVYFVWSNFRISENLRQSQMSQSKNLANLSRENLDENDRLTAVKYALEALPDEENKEDRPVIYEAVYALSQAVGAYNFPDTLDIEEKAQIPAKYKLNASKVTLDGRYLVMLDGYYLLRFFDIQTLEEIGEVGADEAVTLLTLTDEDELLVAGGNRLTAIDMHTAEVLWTQTYEQNILGMCVVEEGEDNQKTDEEADGKSSYIVLVFEKYVLAVGFDRQEILMKFDSGSEEEPFCYRVEHPYTFTQYPYGDDENGHSFYYDEENGKVYVISKPGSSDSNTGINGVLVLDTAELRADFYPMEIDCSEQYSMMADETGLYLICEKQDGEYVLNTAVTNDSRRTGWQYTHESALTVLKTDLGGKILWEKRLSITGTNMIGHIRLLLLSGENLESAKEDPAIIGVIFSNRMVCMDIDDGLILSDNSLQSEISDVTVQSDETGLFAFTIEGNLGLLWPENTGSTLYTVFKKSVSRACIRVPEFWENQMSMYLQRNDGVWIYCTKSGDDEYVSYAGKAGAHSTVRGCLSGRDHFVCTLGKQEFVVLDLENNTVDLRTIEDYGLKWEESLFYLDPEDAFYIVYGRSDEGDVLKKIFLNDLTSEDIIGPGMLKDDDAYSYAGKPVCVKDKILYFAVKGSSIKDPFCLCIYDIPSGSWTIHRLGFSMLNLILPMSVSQDGGIVLTQDQYGNGYLIRTEDAAVTELPDKIPVWTDSCWNGDGTAFALFISGAEKEQIVSIDTSGKELFRVGKEYMQPLSMTYHGSSLWVLYEDSTVCEYDAKTGALLVTIDVGQGGLNMDRLLLQSKPYYWDFTDDGQLILNKGNSLAQIDLKLGGMVAQVREGAGYAASRDQILVFNAEKTGGDDKMFVGYPRYTVDDLIRKGKELKRGLLTGSGEADD